MTCIELRCYLQNEDLALAKSGDDGYSAEVAEHIRICEECCRFAGEQSEVRGLLNLVRDSTPQTSPSLDSAVLANFRKRVELVPVPGVVASRRLPTSLFWRSAIAAVILLVIMLPWAYRRIGMSRRPVQPVRAVVPLPTPAANSTSEVAKEGRPASTASAPRRAKRKAVARATESAAAVAPAPFPRGFNRLMYCDPLSCEGTMEVIRMQLPADLSTRPSAGHGERVVFADFIVGSDGVARGIRLVE